MAPIQEQYKGKNEKSIPGVEAVLAQPASLKFETKKPEDLEIPKNFNEREEMLNSFNQKIDDLETLSFNLGNYDKEYSKYLNNLKEMGGKIYSMMDELLLRNEEKQITFTKEEEGFEVRFTIKRSGDKDGRLLLEEIKIKKVTPESERIDGISEEKNTKNIFINPRFRGNIDAVTVTEFTDEVKDKERKKVISRTEEIPGSEDIGLIFKEYGSQIKAEYDKLLYSENLAQAA